MVISPIVVGASLDDQKVDRSVMGGSVAMLAGWCSRQVSRAIMELTHRTPTAGETIKAHNR
eukprot:scaffold44606_cov176-Amphora_coffeaeformis.AAC.3